MNFPTDELSKRITEFQVAEGPGGALVGAVGLQIAQKQARIHSEAFSDFSLADQLRPLLWERINAVAINHGLLRLWSQEQAPFWSRCGLQTADAAALEKLPEAWRNQGLAWLTLKLKDDLDTLISADKEFALFMESKSSERRRRFNTPKCSSCWRP